MNALHVYADNGIMGVFQDRRMEAYAMEVRSIGLTANPKKPEAAGVARTFLRACHKLGLRAAGRRGL